MPTPSEIELLRREMTALKQSEESCAIGRERQILPRRQGAFDSMNAHSQADEPPLSFVMEFNAAQREWCEAQTRLNKMPVSSLPVTARYLEELIGEPPSAAAKKRRRPKSKR
jgi:hypothetical protein